jgi:hypothetical protein
MTTTTTVASYPWQPESTVTGNLAIGNLRENLLKSLKTQHGIHTETLLTAVGALAGFAAQNAALAQVTSHAQQEVTVPPGSIVVAGTTSGERFLFGDAINIHLFPEPNSTLPLFALIGSAVIQAGLTPDQLPNYKEMAKHVAAVVGGPQFGLLRAPKDHQPQLQPLELLLRLWPLTRDLMGLPLPKSIPPDREPPLKEVHWPIVVSLVASQFIAMAKGVLNPGIGAALVMESAVITSKIDPEKIEPGKWRITPHQGALKVARLK